MRPLPTIIVSVALASIGYGLSFPLLALELERMGVSGLMIGINAAMPALGWLIGSPAVPYLQQRLGLAAVLVVCLGVAAATALLLSTSDSYVMSTCLRFAFGGALGLYFRAVEYWLNAVSTNDVRGRTIGVYGVVFMLGVGLGSAALPILGFVGVVPYATIAAFLAVSGVVVWLLPISGSVEIKADDATWQWPRQPVMFIALLGSFAYGTYEVIPAYLMPAYAAKNHLGDDVAAYTFTAFAIGSVVFPIPLGILSDRMNRVTLILVCALVSLVCAALLPFVLSIPLAFLAIVAVWGGFASAIYSIALSMVGDHYQGADLARGNAAMGVVYAAGSLIGPLVNGAALDGLESQGLIVAACAAMASFIGAAIYIGTWAIPEGAA